MPKNQAWNAPRLIIWVCLATVINCMALQNALESIGVDTRLQSAIKMEQICEPYIRRRAMHHLSENKIVIFGAGTGNPYFTTDTAASLRAIEIKADVVLKGTRVDGIYTADPEKDPTATRYDEITFQEVYDKGLECNGYDRHHPLPGK